MLVVRWEYIGQLGYISGYVNLEERFMKNLARLLLTRSVLDVRMFQEVGGLG